MLNLQTWNRTNLHLSVAYVLWRRRWYLLALTVLGAAAAGGWTVLAPKSYRATALVLVEPQKVPEKYVGSAVSTDVQDRLASISQQILSNTRLQKIIDDFQLYRTERSRLYPEEILELMRKRITIKLEKGWTQDRPGAFHVDYEGTDPVAVAEVTNRLVSLFLEENLRERELSAEGTSDFLEGQLQEARRRLQELEVKVAEYKLAHVGSLPGQEGYLNGAIARLQQELLMNDESVARDKVSKTTIESAMEAAKGSMAMTAQLAARMQPAEEKPVLLSERIAEEVERARLRFTARHPTMVALQQELERVKAAEKRMPPASGKKAAGVTETPQYLQWQIQVKEREEALRTQLKLLDQDMAARTARRKEIVSQIKKLEGQLAQLPVSELEMGGLTRDYELTLAAYRSLLEKRQNAQMAAEMEHRQKGESFKVLDAARVPQRALGLPPAAVVGAGAGSGLVLGAVGFLALFLQRNWLLGEWEIPDGVPVLVQVPVFGKGRRRGMLVQRPGTRLAAAVAMGLMAVAGTAALVVYRFGK